VKLLMKQVPVYYMIFDVLYLDNQITMPLPFKKRREILDGLMLSGDYWRTSPAIEGEGKSMYDTATAHTMEGIVAKKLDSAYEPGRRSPNWLKIKIIQSQELVVGGWCPEKGDNRSRIGSLLLGYYDQGRLRYAGSVGTGYTDAIHRQLVEKLSKIGRSSSPFVDKVPKPKAIYVDPKLVVEVDYRRWPENDSVARRLGLRMDKKASLSSRRADTRLKVRASGKQMRWLAARSMDRLDQLWAGQYSVKLYNAIREERCRFTCSTIRTTRSSARWSPPPAVRKSMPSIVKGYERQGQYVVVTQEELDSVSPKSRTIDIRNFSISTILIRFTTIGRTTLPRPSTRRAASASLEAMPRRQVGIAKFVMQPRISGRFGQEMADSGSILRISIEIVPMDQVPALPVTVSKTARWVAMQLIESLAGDFKPGIQDEISRSGHGDGAVGRGRPSPSRRLARPAVIDLMVAPEAVWAGSRNGATATKTEPAMAKATGASRGPTRRER
jgi:hypothetical protein